MRRLVAAGIVLLSVSWPAAADAREDRLRYDLRIDIPVTAALLLGAVAVGVWDDDLQPDSCRWCGRNGVDELFREHLRWSNVEAADTVSDVGRILVPALCLGALAWAANEDDRLGDLPVDLLVGLEAVAAASMLAQVAKIVAARPRPYVRDLPSGEGDPDDLRSFFSHHSSGVFAAVLAAYTVAHLRGRAFAPWILVVGLPLAATTAYLRIAADRHYMTDVLVGSAVGAGVGFSVPYLFHRE